MTWTGFYAGVISSFNTATFAQSFIEFLQKRRQVGTADDERADPFR